MLELDQRIRAFIDAGTTPVTADEVVAGRTVADGKARYRPSVFNRRRLGLGAIGVVAVAASLLLVLSLTTTSIHNGIAPADASTFLKGEAAKAALEPPIVPGYGEFLYVRTLDGYPEGSEASEASGTNWAFYVQQLEEVWSSPDASGKTDFRVVGQPLFITAADRAAWEAAGSPPIASGYSCCPPDVYYDITDLPTNPARIASYLDRQQSLREQDVPPVQKTKAFYHFDGALKFLGAGASSLQRSALLRYMATIPGVRLLGSATTLGTHKTGKVISIAVGASGTYEQAIFDPRSSELLEIRLIGRGPLQPPGAPPTNVPGPARGAANIEHIRYYFDTVYVGISSSTNTQPKAAPPLPAQWLYGTTRPPLPGSVYP